MRGVFWSVDNSCLVLKLEGINPQNKNCVKLGWMIQVFLPLWYREPELWTHALQFTVCLVARLVSRQNNVFQDIDFQAFVRRFESLLLRWQYVQKCPKACKSMIYALFLLFFSPELSGFIHQVGCNLGCNLKPPQNCNPLIGQIRT